MTSSAVPSFSSFSTQRRAAHDDGSGESTTLPTSPLRHYFSRKSSSRIRTKDLPYERGAKGFNSPLGYFFIWIGLTVPFAYIYILLILLRELCICFPETIFQPIQYYLPLLAKVVYTMKQSSILVEVWCVIEAIFYVCVKLQIQWLQSKDTLEASLSSAPMLEMEERKVLWDLMMETERHDPVSFIQGWFFDESIENISKYDARDFCVWSMFEGRNQEHLTGDELAQLDEFVDDIEYRISVHLYGIEEEEEEEEDVSFPEDKEESLPDGKHKSEETALVSTPKKDLLTDTIGKHRPRPKKMFRFHESNHDETPNFFSNLYENYRNRYEQYRNMIESSEFHPVQDLRNFMAETRQHIVDAEESAVATATHMCQDAYSTLISPGSNIDKQLHAIGHSFEVQFTEARNSMRGMKERLETAEFLSSQRKRIRQQLKGYRLLLNRMRSMSSSVPSKQMAVLMRKITECNDALERVESSAQHAFMKATGFARKNLLFQRNEPKPYAKFNSDPLLGIRTYPLGFHLLILGASEGGLRIMMSKRGFSRLTVGPVAYYYHPGTGRDSDDDEEEQVPIVFVHGIGLGLIMYMPLIDEMLKLGRPILLPEIPYVSAFRPLQSPNAVLPPAVVSSTMTAMLATHGYLRGVFAGHSYGTSWLSYMCKFAPQAIAAVLFLDPICFCLHVPHLTKQFVYHRPDPGSISYMVRTDVIINWTIQRSFPWARISLFAEQIGVPCCVFLSELDALVPADIVERYLRSHSAPVVDFTDVDKEHFATGDINVTVFRGDGHGDWTEKPSNAPVIRDCIEVLCNSITELDDPDR